MLHPSWIDPKVSAAEVLHRRYDWEWHPLAPLGCKAVVYKNGNQRGLWASRGVDGLYLGPSIDHYWCNKYYIPKIRLTVFRGWLSFFPSIVNSQTWHRTSILGHLPMNWPSAYQHALLKKGSMHCTCLKQGSTLSSIPHLLTTNKGCMIAILVRLNACKNNGWLMTHPL